MKTINFWKAYSVSNQKAMFSFAPVPIWPTSCILQHGRHETGFRLYLSKISLESIKTIHFWKAYSISNQINNVSFAPVPIWPPSCILQHGRHETGFRLYLSKISLESIKTIHFWKAYSISNQINNVSFAPVPIWPPSCILQHGRHETGFRLYLSKISLESIKTIHFLKASSISNQKNNALICPESNMATILHFTKWPEFNMAAFLHFLGH